MLLAAAFAASQVLLALLKPCMEFRRNILDKGMLCRADGGASGLRHVARGVA